MKPTTYGCVGNGKLGTLLSKRPNFISIDCDITNPSSIIESYESVDVLVNCAGVSSIDECENHERHATEVNVRGTYYLHEYYKSRVLTISSDYVFSGNNFFLPKEDTLAYPVNHYGWTKVGAEAVSKVNGGKVIRLSRTVSIEDDDISRWLMALYRGDEIYVPSFFSRSYLTRSQAVDGLEYFAKHFDSLPSVVNYGATDTVSMYLLMRQVAMEFGLEVDLVKPNTEYNPNMTPRPLKGGFNTKLAKSLGFPMYDIQDVAKQLAKDANA